MQRLMLRLDALVRRHQRLVLVGWLIALAVAVPFAMRQSEDLSAGGFSVPGSQSLAVQEALDRDFPDAPRSFLGAVVIPREGASTAAVREAVLRVERAAHAAPSVELTPATRDKALKVAAAGGGPVVLPFVTDVADDDAIDVASDLRKDLKIGEETGGAAPIHLLGQGALWAGMQALSKEDLAQAESVGFPIVLLILLVVFGSFTAAMLPLGLGLMSVLITGALIFAVSQVMDMSVFVTNMASMIGIGVAVDYSLFILARYREEVRAGRSPDEARATAMATSGIAVMFSGLTVIVSLAGLFMIQNQALRSMALGAILVVAVSILASATLLPALIRWMGHRAYARSRIFTVIGLVRRSWQGRRAGSTRPGTERLDMWQRWTSFVTRRPGVSAVAAAAVLLVLAIPALSLTTAAGALRQFPEGNETRVGFEAAAKVTGPGASSPVRVLVRGDTAIAQARSVLAADPAIASVDGVQRAPGGDAAIITATPRLDGESPASKEMVKRLRAELPGARIGGVSAAQTDVSELITGSLWKIMLFVLGLSYLVLLVLLRSVVLPLKAVLMNLLSVGAAYGVMVAVFQYGWLDGFMGFQSNGYLDTLTPPLVLAVVFGLSMDYEVFLLSRIKERYEATKDTKRAVAEGLGASARTITSAALIMVAVFAVFVGTGVPSIKQIGLGNAVAIAVDATLVRLVLVPAMMELLGKWNWYLPAWLDRLLPHTAFEQLDGGTPGGPPAPPPAPSPERDRDPVAA